MIGERRKEVVGSSILDSESDSGTLCVEADGENWKSKGAGKPRFHSASSVSGPRFVCSSLAK